MARIRDDAPPPGSRRHLLALLGDMQAEARAARLDAEVARIESRALSMAILSRIEVLMRVDISLIRKVNLTMSIVDDIAANVAEFDTITAGLSEAFDKLTAAQTAALADLQGKLTAAQADDASVAESFARLETINAELSVKKVALIEAIKKGTPVEAEPAPEPTPEPPVVEEPPVAEQPAPPAETPAEPPAQTDPAAQQ